jgi:glutathione S-transferase
MREATDWLRRYERFRSNSLDRLAAKWAKLRRSGAVEFVQKRLSALSKSLGEKPYLDGDRFTVQACVRCTDW